MHDLTANWKLLSFTDFQKMCTFVFCSYLKPKKRKLESHNMLKHKKISLDCTMYRTHIAACFHAKIIFSSPTCTRTILSNNLRERIFIEENQKIHPKKFFLFFLCFCLYFLCHLDCYLNHWLAQLLILVLCFLAIQAWNLHQNSSRARICKLLRSPGIDSGSLCSLAGQLITLFVVPARQASKAGGIGPWNQFLGCLKVYKFGHRNRGGGGLNNGGWRYGPPGLLHI